MSGIILGIWTYSQLQKQYQYLIQLLIWVFTIEIVGKIVQIYLMTNFPLYHLLIIIQFVYFSLIFYEIFDLESQFLLIFKIMLIVICCISLITSTLFSNIFEFPSLNFILFSIYAIVGVLIVFTKMLKKPLLVSPLKQPIFWFATSTIMFYSVTFIFFSIHDVFSIEEYKYYSWGYTLVKVSNYILYSCYFLAIFFDSRGKTNTIDG